MCLVNVFASWCRPTLHAIITGGEKDGAQDVDQQMEPEVSTGGCGAASFQKSRQTVGYSVLRRGGNNGIDVDEENSSCRNNRQTRSHPPSLKVFLKLDGPVLDDVLGIRGLHKRIRRRFHPYFFRGHGQCSEGSPPFINKLSRAW